MHHRTRLVICRSSVSWVLHSTSSKSETAPCVATLTTAPRSAAEHSVKSELTDSMPQNIVVCCDGTWCGTDTGTRTNIQILADAFASHGQGRDVWLQPPRNTPMASTLNTATNTHVCYHKGIGTDGFKEGMGVDTRGLFGGFLDLLVYCANGVVATDLAEHCKRVYRYIAEQYNGPDQSRIWLFGLSRGAYTVRAVAGMINNCGIIKDATDDALVDEVWRIYCEDSVEHKPAGEAAIRFKSDASKVWPLDAPGNLPPIAFMGLLDTVGATGLPRIEPLAPKQITYNYRPFRDFVVSQQVEAVFQACSTHDRLTPFEPCFVRRKWQEKAKEQKEKGTVEEQERGLDGDDDIKGVRDTRRGAAAAGASSSSSSKVQPYLRAKYKEEEVWYPGAHYDLGRQDFVFSNQPITNWLNSVLNMFRTNVNCTPELADYPLVGCELGSKEDPPQLTDLSSHPPCIVGRVCCLNNTLLPLPTDKARWRALVRGPILPRSLWEFLTDTTTHVVKSVPGKALQFAGKLLPWELFQPSYDIDAETKILLPLAKAVGYVLTGTATEDVVLKNRRIPLPGEDDWGFTIGAATFFPVPSDGSDTGRSFKAHGRGQNWFLSTTYDDYVNALAAPRAGAGAQPPQPVHARPEGGARLVPAPVVQTLPAGRQVASKVADHQVTAAAH